MTQTANKCDEQEVTCLTHNHSVKPNSFVLKASQRVGITSFRWIILDNEDSYLDVEKISSKLKDCIIKTN